MAEGGDTRPDEGFPQEWVTHADRCWKAERATADQLNERKRQVLTASAALIGLGLFGVQWLRDPRFVPNVRYDAVMIAMRCLMGLALFAFGVSLGWMLVRRTPGPRAGLPRFPSRAMQIPAGMLPEVTKHTASQARLESFTLTYAAYRELLEENVDDGRRLERAQAAFMVGVGLVFLAVILYIAYSFPPINDAERSDGGGTDGRSTTRTSSPVGSSGAGASDPTRGQPSNHPQEVGDPLGAGRRADQEDGVGAATVQHSGFAGPASRPVLIDDGMHAVP